MLKWAVYGKKNNENPSNRFDGERRLDYTNGPYAGRSARRSLDANSIKQSRKPARYQRRSLSSAATKKSNIKTVDKENVNYVGHTPNCYKEGFSTKKPDIANALKDVSNITPSAVTPTTPVYKKKPTDDGPRWYQGKSTDSVPSDLNGTPSTYSRKIREAKKRKLEMAAEVNTKDKIANEDCGLNTESPVASKEENNIKERLSIVVPQKTLSRSLTSSYILDKDTKNKHPVSTTNTAGDESVEIEYSSEEYVKYRREFPNAAPDKTTLPIFGSRILLENPLYFNNPELSESILPSKRTRKKSNEFESSFKSPSVDKNVHSLIREGFSPISITPLSNKLAALRFSTLRCHGHEKKVVTNNHFNSNFTKGPNAFSLSMMRDEEISTEMENKFIVPGEITSLETESVSDSQMGDMTLEKMIEDIIKSTKKVKSRRKMLQDKPNNVASRNKTLIKTDNKELVESHMFVKPCTENKNNLIREAKHVNLSRENSMSPKCSPKKIDNSKTNTPDFFLKLGISNNCNRSFILDDCTIYNEREVKTPENKLTIPPTIISIDNKTNEKIHVERSKSFSVVSSNRDKVVSADNKSSESTPNIPFDTQENSKYRLKRQKCVRRKKSTVSIEGSWKKRETKPSILTLEMGIPSPYLTEIDEISKYDPRSSSFNCITGPCNEEDSDIYIKRKPLRSNSTSSNVSHSSMLLNQSSPRKPCTCKPLFGLTLENGIPSPITPVANLKRTNSNLSEERLHKSCKLDAEYINAADGTTPLIEYKSSRRCLTFSPEDASFNSSEEKRRSVASNKSGRSVEHVHAVKGTIELSIICRNGVVDVHVIRCRDLQKTSGKTDDINAYTKVLISGTNEYQPFGTQRSVFQRTSVLYGRREPEFQRHLKLPLPGTIYDHLLIHVSVWHRDKKYRRSEFLGCVSFPLKDVIKSDVSGCYYLQSQVSAGRAPVAPDAHALQEAARESGRKRGVTAHGDMATDNMDGGNTNDSEKESASDKGIAANGTGGGGAGGGSGCAGAAGAHAALQREADEHLFLRYLELDPVEGTEGTPTPRRAGARQGRTPFTSTRRLLRTGTGGFGFTVVWTQPPRLERVAPGGPAERAGARPGDYLVFVGTKNVVTAPEEQVRQLVHSSGPTLILETFRRVAQNGLLPSAAIQRGSTASHLTSSDLDVITRPLEPLTETYMPSATVSAAPSAPSAAPSAPSGSTVRPGTACSAATSQSLDVTAARRKLHLPQVTFSKETPAMTHEQQRRRALLAVVAREQHYATCLQFGLGRFVAPLAERSDLITPADHQLLFQNIEEILRLSEDILDQVVHEDGEIQASTVVAVYLQKTPMFLSLYKKYCLGLKRADCVLVKKSRDPSGAFVRFCTSPPLPRRRPDITSLVHKPLEQFRELLRLMRTAAAAGVGNGANSTYEQYERKPLQAIADQLQHSYQEVTAGSGLMGLAGDGKPLLSVADLESRLVFTRCKPFVLGTPGRQWIFGGELSRVEGRTVKPYWALLFSDLLLFATVSRDRVLFITEEPVALATVSDACFNVRKKATEFRLTLGRAGGESPLVSCSPRALLRARSITLRTPSLDLKAVWQSLLQRQIYRVHTMSGTPLGSPLDSPDPQLTFSLATLDSQRQVSAPNVSSFHRHSSLSHLMASYRSHLNILSVDEREENETAKHELRVSFDVRTDPTSPAPLRAARGPLSAAWRAASIAAALPAPTPDTPSANLSPAESIPDSQTFSSHFVSMTSIERVHDSSKVTPSSPSAAVTPSEGCAAGGWARGSPCHWESFEADLALADLDVDPSYKHAVEERIFMPEEPLVPRSFLPERPTPPAYLEL